MIYGMKCTQYYKIHNTEHKRYSFKTLNKYNWPPDNPKNLLLYNGSSGGIVTVPIAILDSCQG
jgi:hypothetical protein